VGHAHSGRSAVPSGHALTGGRDSCVAFQEALDTPAWLVARGTYTWFGGAAGEQPCTGIAAAKCRLGNAVLIAAGSDQERTSVVQERDELLPAGAPQPRDGRVGLAPLLLQVGSASWATAALTAV
jgi:hypothetical protein